MKPTLTLLLLIILTMTSHAQRESTNLIVGYQQQHYPTLEVGIAHGVRNQYLYHNTHLSGELLFRPHQSNLLGIKAGYSASLLILQFNAQAIYYTELYNDSRIQSTAALRPELGLSFLGIAQITYGYNIFLSKTTLGISNHLLSLRITFGTLN
ncbi:hypothetical protein LX69_00012 [Breznakibacter xylanolyticus]|uniref:Outer membrane protein with beta-barrel domain n=1 Tax=Breznakibacter xylanolyticus TaxID=990 RepID=A0A2W7PB79_9BACT|nr:hypothetical protein [Breznakibacter xylanolyticus]PZX20592.1 hypothetical protein LX69_00012 [Breznakibacter xylanolyticus]